MIRPGVEPTDQVMITAFVEHVPSFLGGLGLAGVMAAIMSTASTLFVLVGFGMARDLYEQLTPGKISERRSLAVNRICQIIVALVVCLIAVTDPGAIYYISVYAGAIFSVGWLPSVVAGLEWRRMNSKAAVASMILGVGTFILTEEGQRFGWLTLPVWLEPLMVAFAVAVVALVVVAAMTKPKQEEVAYFTEIRAASPSRPTIQATLARPGGTKVLKAEVRNTVIACVAVLVAAVVLWTWLASELV